MINIMPTAEDLYLYHEGTCYRSYRFLGAHPCEYENQLGVQFVVWAPHARDICVLGDFNGWNGQDGKMERISTLGLWRAFVPGAKHGDYYKYQIHTWDGRLFLKADPYAFYAEVRPGTASRVYDWRGYAWQDHAWLEHKRQISVYNRPLSIYEVHLGTWKKPDRFAEEGYSYGHLSSELVDYAVNMGYTHIELMPLAEHPYDRSWGYQATGYFAVTSRFGTPHDFMQFVDRCHQRGLGVIMDWVPGHFCKDDHGLRQFDGQPLYEYEDEGRAEKKQWGTLTFDFGRPEVGCFLISNALFWMDVYHIDGLRVDAVASMLSLNFGVSADSRIYNQHGGEEHLEAISFLRRMNQVVFHYYPDALMMAEDSSDWPLVTAPVHDGGLGFNYKWNMGWMNDVLRYMQLDPIDRQYHHHLLTFSFMYTYAENYLLPLSHDEVVHGKRSLLHKMPGDVWQKFANLRLLYSYMVAHPGKKLLFMGCEFAQFDEWKDLEELDWFLINDYPFHAQMKDYVQALNHFYLNQPALWQLDHEADGFQWIEANDANRSIVVFLRKSSHSQDELIVVCNFTPVVHEHYRVRVPRQGVYLEVFNSDEQRYGGSGQLNRERLMSERTQGLDGFTHVDLILKVPPLAVVYVKWVATN